MLLIIDWFLALTRAALSQARLPLMIGLAGQSTEKLDRSISLVERASLRTTLRLLRLLVQFSLAVLVWLEIAQLAPGMRFAARMGWLLGAGLLLVTSEHALERLVLRAPELWVTRLGPLLAALDTLLRPLSALLLKLSGPHGNGERRSLNVTEDELKNWVETEQEEGSLEKDERQMIYSIFHFGDTLVREIMVPRIDILALDVNTPLETAVEALTGSGHSRVPVYSETIDNIVGLLYAKDLLRLRREGESSDIAALLRPAYFVPEAKKVDDLLREMQARSVHMAIVVDEYGGMAGLVTLEDIVEEIVGEIRDEYDQGEELPYQATGEGEYIFSARASIDDVNDLLGIQLDDETADTLGGYIYSSIGRVPAGGEEVHVPGWTLRVEVVSGRRIRKVRAYRQEQGITAPLAGEEEN